MNKRWITLGMISTELNNDWQVGKAEHFPLFLMLFDSYPTAHWVSVRETLIDNKEDLDEYETYE